MILVHMLTAPIMEAWHVILLANGNVEMLPTRQPCLVIRQIIVTMHVMGHHVKRRSHEHIVLLPVIAHV